MSIATDLINRLKLLFEGSYTPSKGDKNRMGNNILITILPSDFPKTISIINTELVKKGKTPIPLDRTIQLDMGDIDPDELTVWAKKPVNIKNIDAAFKRASNSQSERESQYWMSKALNPGYISRQYATKVLRKEVIQKVDNWSEIGDAARNADTDLPMGVMKASNPEDTIVFSDLVLKIYEVILKKYGDDKMFDLVAYWIIRNNNTNELRFHFKSPTTNRIIEIINNVIALYRSAEAAGINPENQREFRELYLKVFIDKYNKFWLFMQKYINSIGGK